MNKLADATERFTSRVQDYVRYRPRYPAAVVDVLRDRIGLRNEWSIADIGSGTGISAELFLGNGNRVFAVEPNQAMRSAAEHLLRDDPNFKSVNGTAEVTTLPPQSIDLVVAAQAFHWFDISAYRKECRRILKASGWALLMWNDRQITGSPFLDAYEQLLCEFGTDYKQIQHRNLGPEHIGRYFGGEPQLIEMPNAQRFDLSGLRGRLTSSSYVPQEGSPSFEPMCTRLAEIFEKHQADGQVTMLYTTQLFIAPLDAGNAASAG